MIDESSTEFVQSLARGLSVLSAFSNAHPSMTLSEVAELTGLNRATARRFLLTLESLGYVRSSGKEFALTSRVMDLGYSYLSSLGLAEILAPHLAALSTAAQESASAAVLEGTDVVYVARHTARKIMQVQISVGTRFPAYATSLGRALLGDMSASERLAVLNASERDAQTPFTVTDVRTLDDLCLKAHAEGYALVDQELELGLRSLAVPVHNAQGKVIASINVSTSSQGTAKETVSRFLPSLLECAMQVEADLAGRPG